MVSCNVLVPQLFWFKKSRTTIWILHDRLDPGQRRDVVRALRHHRHLAEPRLPAVGLGLLQADCGRHADVRSGSFGLFFTLFLLFVRFLPMVAMAEVKSVMTQAHPVRDILHRGAGDYHGDIPAIEYIPKRTAPTEGDRMSRTNDPKAARPRREASLRASRSSSRRVGALLHACETGSRRRIQEVGCVHPLPGSRAERCDGDQAHAAFRSRSVGAATGAGLGLLMQWWMNAVDYQLIISGKPFFGLPANIPITFELTILLRRRSAAFVGMLAFNGLPMFHHPIFASRLHKRATSDRFVICIEAADPRFDEQRTEALLDTLGGLEIEKVWREER